MRISRLIDQKFLDIQKYKDYEFDDFFYGAAYSSGFKIKINDKNFAHAFAVAFYLKQANIWLDDKFVFNGENYLLKGVSVVDSTFELKANISNIYEIKNHIELWGCKKDDPVSTGISVSLDEVKWVFEGGEIYVD